MIYRNIPDEVFRQYRDPQRVYKDIEEFLRKCPTFYTNTANMIVPPNQRITVVCVVGRMRFVYKDLAYYAIVGFYVPLEYPNVEPRAVVVPEGYQEVNVCYFYDRQGVVRDMANWPSNGTIETKFGYVQRVINQMPPVKAKMPQQSYQSIFQSVMSTVSQNVGAALSTARTNVGEALFGKSAGYTAPAASTQAHTVPANYMTASQYVPPVAGATYMPRQTASAYQIPQRQPSGDSYLPSSQIYTFINQVSKAIALNNEQKNKMVENSRSAVAFHKKDIEQATTDIVALLQNQSAQHGVLEIPKHSSVKEIVIHLQQSQDRYCTDAEIEAVKRASDLYIKKLVEADVRADELAKLLALDDLDVRLSVLGRYK